SFALLSDVEGYPGWYPDVVRRVHVLERDAQQRARRARATLHVAYGPLVRDFDLVLAVKLAPPTTVGLERIPHEPRDQETFKVTWRVSENSPTTIAVQLEAHLPVPRL